MLLLLAAGCGSSGSAAKPARGPLPPASSGSHQRLVHGRVQLRLVAHVAAHLPNGVSRAVAVPRAGRILVLGGLAAGDVTTGRVVSLDPATGRSRDVGALGEPVHDAAGALVGGTPVVFGGGAATEVADVQAWSGSTSRVVGRLPAGRSDSAAAVVAGTAYVVGGFDGRTLQRDIVATSDGQAFRVVGTLRQGVRYPAVTSYQGAVWVVGGELATTEGTSGGPESALVQRFDPATGRTTVAGRLPHPLGHAMAFTIGGSLYVVGGRRAGVAQRTIWRIDPDGRAVGVGRLPFAESDAAVVNEGGRVYLVGGETSGPLAPLRTVLALSLE